MKMMNFNSPPLEQPPIQRIEPFQGVNMNVTPTQINESQSPDMLNMLIDERGALIKRTGYEKLFNTSLGSGKINGLYMFRMLNGDETLLIAHGTKLYRQTGREQPIQIYSGLQNRRVEFFTMGDKCYLLDGTNYLEISNTFAVSAVQPYVPTLLISKSPTGGGTLYEDFNLLGGGFKETFSGNGTAKDYSLSLKGLDSTTPIVKVDNVAVTAFTFNAANGTVSFTTAPASGTNNVEITAYKTQAGFPDKIKKCTFSTLYGGANDTRIFLSGNVDTPEYVYASDLYNPAYFPENRFYKFSDKVQGFSKQYDYLVVHRVNGMSQMSFTLDADTVSTFTIKPLNDSIGTIASESVQLIENNPISLSKNGVYVLTSSAVRDERNVFHVSENVDKKLLSEANLENAVTVDFDKKYWIALNGNVYVMDYANRSETSVFGEWYIYDNIHASCFVERDKTLMFGSNTDGILYYFKPDTHEKPYNDDGVAIKAYWRSKHFAFGMDERRKLVAKVFYGLKPQSEIKASFFYRTDKKTSGLLKAIKIKMLDFRTIDFTNFSFLFTNFPLERMLKIKAKKVTHFQLIIESNDLDHTIGLLSLGVKFTYQSEVKR